MNEVSQAILAPWQSEAKASRAANDNLELLSLVATRVTSGAEGMRVDDTLVTAKKFRPIRRVPEREPLHEVIPDTYPEIVRSLASALYDKIYVEWRWWATMFAPNTDRLRDEEFFEEIRLRQTSRWSMIGNFTVVGKENGVYRLSAPLWDDVFVPPEYVEGPDPGGKAKLLRNPIMDAAQPAFVHLMGEEAIPAGWTRTSRFYWSLGPEGVLPLVAVMSRRFNDARIPFQYKVLRHPTKAVRPDSAVLYVPSYALARATPVLAAVYDEVKLYCRKPLPPLSKALAPGLSFAEDPFNGHSFGEHRMQILAMILWDAFQNDVREPGDLLRALVEGLAARGYPLDRLHLNPESTHDVDLKVEAPRLPLEDYA